MRCTLHRFVIVTVVKQSSDKINSRSDNLACSRNFKLNVNIKECMNTMTKLTFHTAVRSTSFDANVYGFINLELKVTQSYTKSVPMKCRRRFKCHTVSSPPLDVSLNYVPIIQFL